jgi:predicted nuclease of restriction endonuclease-like (RecB) superfamily
MCAWSLVGHTIATYDQQARDWYMQEAVQENWSTRTLERQINSFYYQRILTRKNRKPVQEEAKKKAALSPAHDVLKDPYFLEFFRFTGST